MAEKINLDYMVSRVGSKARLAIFFGICRSAINQWEIFGGKNYVPQGRVYEFLSRKSEWDKPIKS